MGKRDKPPNQAGTVLATSKLIISAKQARKLLGKDAKDLSDDEVEAIIITLTALASTFLRVTVVPEHKQDTIQL